MNTIKNMHMSDYLVFMGVQCHHVFVPLPSHCVVVYMYVISLNSYGSGHHYIWYAG